MSDTYGTPSSVPLIAEAPIKGIGFVAAIKRYFTKYATFTGRASQSEYWWVMLFNALVGIVLSVLSIIAFAISASGAAVSSYSTSSSYSSAVAPTGFGLVLFILVIIIGAAYGLGTIVPAIALYVRRLHDADRSGLLAFLLLIPYGNSIVAIVFGFLPSNPAGARYDKN